MRAVIHRRHFEQKQTLGELRLEKNGKTIFECKTLELPWRNNAVQKSCIPAGKYQVVTRFSPKFKNHFHVLDVPGRSWILIHAGNYYTDILGCILVGEKHLDLNGDGPRDVTDSKNTLKKLLQLAPEGFELSIQ
ncbi:hypothetical protein EI546_06535 [Aequorivita sp. H23M31]|uniref:DUF5675 domain-containing protein n=1 Tax=Aequorivita ciconiae TaxID=2494375 RepID=A0A410G2B8_9FLAO|nr:DUF5675 family protein [Aequorivita sp. H23M31]QAA81406.1 hypothetical protein EI546_06535 [Aequorivita sp. H23M31]